MLPSLSLVRRTGRRPWRTLISGPPCANRLEAQVWYTGLDSQAALHPDSAVSAVCSLHLAGARSVPFSRSVVSDSLRPQGLQHARLPCPSPTPGACSNSCPLSRGCHPTTSRSVVQLRENEGWTWEVKLSQMKSVKWLELRKRSRVQETNRPGFDPWVGEIS